MDIWFTTTEDTEFSISEEYLRSVPDTYFGMIYRRRDEQKSIIKVSLCSFDVKLFFFYLENGLFPCPYYKSNTPHGFPTVEDLINFLCLPNPLEEIVDYGDTLAETTKCSFKIESTDSDQDIYQKIHQMDEYDIYKKRKQIKQLLGGEISSWLRQKLISELSTIEEDIEEQKEFDRILDLKSSDEDCPSCDCDYE